MDPVTKKSWRDRGWTIPLSVMLHILIVGAFYLQWPENMQAPAEPESVSVELVEPPKEEPPKEEPKPPPEEKKAEEPPPPPPPPEETKPPEPPPPQTRMPNIAIRPDGTQLDERDDPGTQEETGGQEQPKPAEEPETSQPEPKPAEEAQKDETPPEPSSNKPTAEQGEIAAVEADAPPDAAAVAVPTPKPDVEKPEEEPKAQPDGAGDPALKPAKKILAGAKAPTPMRRQILGQLPPRQRVAQLCIVEALAQIKDQRKGQSPAEGLEPHIGKNDPVAGNVLDAQGAFNVGTDWYPIHYRCEINMERYLVTDFRFDIGAKLSPDDVKRIGLVAD